jgi:ABC-2 type transport system permease protein
MTSPSAARAFFALIRLTFQRHWRVRALAWATIGLVALTATAIAVYTFGPVGWRIEDRRVFVADLYSSGGVRLTYKEYAFERLPIYIQFPSPADQFGVKAAVLGAERWLMISDEPDARKFRDDYAFLLFSRWVIFGLFLTFAMPLFCLAYASGAIGSEREGRTLLWLSTRPMPRGGIYLAKFLGVLPWCLAVSLAGFGVVCLAGGELGHQAFRVYLPAVAAGTVGLAALFHFLGAVFRRPAVIGLVYVFFFETLVANLPGSLKRLSMNYYVRSLMYDGASSVATVPAETLDVYEPVSAATAWIVLLAATTAITLIGMWWFARLEPKEEI